MSRSANKYFNKKKKSTLNKKDNNFNFKINNIFGFIEFPISVLKITTFELMLVSIL